MKKQKIYIKILLRPQKFGLPFQAGVTVLGAKCLVSKHLPTVSTCPQHETDTTLTIINDQDRKT